MLLAHEGAALARLRVGEAADQRLFDARSVVAAPGAALTACSSGLTPLASGSLRVEALTCSNQPRRRPAPAEAMPARQAMNQRGKASDRIHDAGITHRLPPSRPGRVASASGLVGGVEPGRVEFVLVGAPLATVSVPGR